MSEEYIHASGKPRVLPNYWQRMLDTIAEKAMSLSWYYLSPAHMGL
jgi:hypothetical protein